MRFLSLITWASVQPEFGLGSNFSSHLSSVLLGVNWITLRELSFPKLKLG